MDELDLEKQQSYLDKFHFPEELQPFEKGLKPAIKVGKTVGEFISDAIDAVVDHFITEK